MITGAVVRPPSILKEDIYGSWMVSVPYRNVFCGSADNGPALHEGLVTASRSITNVFD